MVCLELVDSPRVEMASDVMEYDEILEDSFAAADLQVRQVAGGKITEFPPIFSDDGEDILLVWNNTVRVFNVATGKWVRDLDKTDADLVAIEFDPTNSQEIIGCTKDGDVVTWKWKAGVRCQRIKLNIPQTNFRVMSFNLFEGLDGNLQAVIVYFYDNDSSIKLDVFRLADGESLNGFPGKFNQLSTQSFKVSMNNKQKFFALIQRHVLYVGNLATGKRRFHFNLQNRLFTTVAVHPISPIIATGDHSGKIILWMNTDSYEPLKSIYHWHPAPVKCLSFSESGTHFYSGGVEQVLVKWTHNRPDMRKFLPRMRGTAIHITIAPKNEKIAVALSDNGIQLLNANLEVQTLIQNFCHVADDGTGENPFPAGMIINPRSNCIVLNGRVGHLQFFSTHTKSFLYDVDITGENQMNPEPMSIIYNTRVTRVSICMDWMATAECWNDHEHFIQTKIKFWEFSKEKQLFVLNTDIQMPHEKAITALVFSKIYFSDSVVCASAGGDNFLIIWKCDSAGKSWSIHRRLRYRNYPIKSVAFCQDGTLMVAGFGNVCIVYKTSDLTVKTIFCAPSGLDGGIGKVSFLTPKSFPDANGDAKSIEGKNREISERKSQTIQLVHAFLEKNSNDLLKSINSEMNTPKMQEKCTKIDKIDQEELFSMIMGLKDLDLDQKLCMLHHMEISCNVKKDLRRRMKEYLEKSDILSPNLDATTEAFAANLGEIHKSSKISQLWHIKKRREFHGKFKKGQGNLPDCGDQNNLHENGNASMEEDGGAESPAKAYPLTEPAEIQQLVFSSGEYAHILVAATKNRVLVWDLMSLKLTSVIKISAASLSVDPLTGLFAVFTKQNNLFVFLPSSPIPIYHKRDMPGVYDALWVPRQDPKSTSLSIDWQSQSQLFFLTHEQELLCLGLRNDDDDLLPMVTFLSEADTVSNYTPFGAMIAKQMQERSQFLSNVASEMHHSTGILGKSKVNELINSIPHAMAPANTLSKGFLKSLLIARKKKVESHENADKQSPGVTSKVPTSEEDAKIAERLERMKIWEKHKSTAREKVRRGEKNEVNGDEKLSEIAKSNVQFNM
ncbi:WD repeat-containing protein 75 isoform X2 [Lutzomyia longipalpis]|nr:WD repeat-containing protein 75 isoform X2 [Lutzomyia longipalpis]